MEQIELGAAQRVFRNGLRTRRRTGEALLARRRGIDPDWQQYDQSLGVPGLAGRLRAWDLLRPFESVVEATRKWADGIDTLPRTYIRNPEPYLLVGPPTPEEPFLIAPKVWATWTDATLDKGLKHLDSLLIASEAVPTRQVRAPETRFEELRLTALIHPAQLSGYVARMSPMRTKAEISEAIGAAKELTEACYKAAGARLGLTDLPTDDFPKLGKLVRRELARRDKSPVSQRAQRAITQMGSGLGTLDDALAAIRNELGTGHGRAHPPAGLKRFHGQLAIDAAEMQTRYVANALVDLGLL